MLYQSLLHFDDYNGLCKFNQIWYMEGMVTAPVPIRETQRLVATSALLISLKWDVYMWIFILDAACDSSTVKGQDKW